MFTHTEFILAHYEHKNSLKLFTNFYGVFSLYNEFTFSVIVLTQNDREKLTSNCE